MGISKHSPSFQRQQSDSSKSSILSGVDGNNNTPHKPITKEMESKLLIFLVNSGYLLVVLLNIEDIKGVLLFGVCIMYGVARVIFYIIKQNQDRRMRELDIKERQKRIAEMSNTI